MLTLLLLAQAAPPSPENLGAFAQALLNAVMGGQWAFVVGLVLVAIVWAVRKFLGGVPFFATDEGAFSLNLLSSFLLALATALTAGGWAAVSWAVVGKALEVSFMAAGGFAAVKKFLWPILLRFFPALGTIFNRGDAAAAITTAKTQGLAAAVSARTPKAEDIANGP